MTDGGAGLFTVVWGLGATAIGWVLVTDFRGAAGRAAEMQRSRSPRFGRGSVAGSVVFVRLIAGVFAITGPIALVNGLRDLDRDSLAWVTDTGLPPGFALAFAAVGAVSVLLPWRRSGPLRRMWACGSPVLRSAVLTVTAAQVCFVAALVSGYLTAMLASWLFGGGAVLVMLVSRRRS